MRVPLRGTVAELAAAAGVEPGVPEGLYSDHAELGPADPIEVDPAAADELAGWLARGEQALRALDPDAQPVLWPEHFDLGIQLDEVNYGISLGRRRAPAALRLRRAVDAAHRAVLERAVRGAAVGRRAARRRRGHRVLPRGPKVAAAS